VQSPAAGGDHLGLTSHSTFHVGEESIAHDFLLGAFFIPGELS